MGLEKKVSFFSKDKDTARRKPTDEDLLTRARAYRKALERELEIALERPEELSSSDMDLLKLVGERKDAALENDVLASLNVFIKNTQHWSSWYARDDSNKYIPADLLEAMVVPPEAPQSRTFSEWNQFLGKHETSQIIDEYSSITLIFSGAKFSCAVYFDEELGKYGGSGNLVIEKDNEVILDWSCRQTEMHDISFWEVEDYSSDAIKFIKGLDWVPLVFWVE